MSQTTTPDREFTNEEITVHVHHKPACRIEMSVKTKPQMVLEARKNAIKLINKEASFPGFRKGKAPDEMVLKKFPADVEKQLHKSLADLAFVSAQKLAKVPVLNNNSAISFDLKHQSITEGSELIFSFETEPSIPHIEREGFQGKEIAKAEVGDKQVEEAIRQMRFFYANWSPVVDRPIQDGDYIMIDLETIDGEEVQKVFNHIRFEVSKERMASWMQNLVKGAKSGDVLTGVSEPDDNATEAEKKEFKPKNVRLTIIKAEEASLPEVDDDFAKKVGASDVENMNASIRDLLNKQAEEKVDSELREQVNDYLIEKFSFELPKSLVDTEKKHRFGQLSQDPKFKSDWAKMSQEERTNLEKKVEDEASAAVKLFYLSRQIVQQEKIPVTHQEVQHEAISIYQSHGHHNVEIDKMSKDVYALALSKVVLQKAQDFILKR